MPLKTISQRRYSIRLLCVILGCVLMFGILCTGISANAGEQEPAESTAEGDAGEPEATADPGEPSYPAPNTDEIERLAVWIAAAAGDAKAEDPRTPRDKFTAAYLVGDLDGAKSVIKKVNEAQKEKDRLSIDYDAIGPDYVAALVKEMKTRVEIDAGDGILDKIMRAAGSVLSWITVIGGGNYIVGLVIFSLIIEIAMLPMGIKQQKNSIRQASLRPKEIAIRRKYAGREDQATKTKITTEINEMYQREGFNPASGCLPMLLQFPIIIILYNVVVNPLVYVMGFTKSVSEALVTFVNTSEAAGGFGRLINSTRGTIEISSLIKEEGFIGKLSNFQYFSNSAEIANAIGGSEPPNFGLFGLNLAKVPSLTEMSLLLIFPVLTFIVYYASMKITRKMTYQPVAADQAAGCSNNIMEIVMPAFSVFISFSVPAALGLYWILKSIFGTISRITISKLMPVPQFTEEDYKAAEKELKRGAKDGRHQSSGYRAGASGKPVRSLHRIDDEDFEDTRERAIERKARLEEAQSAEIEEKSDKAAAAGVKNEDDRPMMTLREMLKGKKNKDGKKEDAAGGIEGSRDGTGDGEDKPGEKGPDGKGKSGKK